MRTNPISVGVAIAVAAAALAWPASTAAQEKKPTTAAQEEEAAQFVAIAKGARMPAPQGFSVVLVLGEMQGSGAADGVPAAARKALADMKDFLPYKGYRLLDTQWMLCCGSSTTLMRLRGSDDQDYELELSPPRAAPEGKWYVRFALREPLAGGAAADVSSTNRNRQTFVAAQKREMENRLRTLRERYSENHPEIQSMREQIAELDGRAQMEERAAAEERLNAMQRELSTARAVSALRSHGRSIIDTSFTMEIGETVVVGTSRLKGDTALIALLTAVPAAKTNNR